MEKFILLKSNLWMKNNTSFPDLLTLIFTLKVQFVTFRAYLQLCWKKFFFANFITGTFKHEVTTTITLFHTIFFYWHTFLNDNNEHKEYLGRELCESLDSCSISSLAFICFPTDISWELLWCSLTLSFILSFMWFKKLIAYFLIQIWTRSIKTKLIFSW